MTTQKTAKRGEFSPNWPVPDDYLLELGRMVSVWGAEQGKRKFLS
jgi:hypothetical protein